MTEIPQRISFMYATDENFVRVLLTSLYSLLKNHVGHEVNVFIVLDPNVTVNSRSRLREMGARFGCAVVLIDMPDFEQATHVSLDTKRYSASMFSRLAAGSILPQSIERLIYLDCDTLVCDDLYALWATDMGDMVIGAVNDHRSAKYSRNLGIREGNCYINSSVLLMDLQKYREQHCEQQLLHVLGQLNGLMEFPDNDLICKVMQDKIFLLPLRYNVISVVRMCSRKELQRLRHPAVKVDESEHREALQNPAILHFTTFLLMKGRPWMEGCNHPDAQQYARFLMEATGERPVENSSGARKPRMLATYVMTHVPKGVATLFLGILHAYLKPWAQAFRMKACRKEIPWIEESRDLAEPENCQEWREKDAV